MSGPVMLKPESRDKGVNQDTLVMSQQFMAVRTLVFKRELGTREITLQ